MKASICPNCYWYIKTEDRFFGKEEECEKLSKKLVGVVITQCKHFKEAEQ